LDRWYKYVKENKGDNKDICQYTLVLAKKILQLEKNMAQHKTNERILKYKLEVYQKHFPNFICGSPINTKIFYMGIQDS
jgi:hypothetical protein